MPSILYIYLSEVHFERRIAEEMEGSAGVIFNARRHRLTRSVPKSHLSVALKGTVLSLTIFPVHCPHWTEWGPFPLLSPSHGSLKM
jgi:hypothetical protein